MKPDSMPPPLENAEQFVLRWRGKEEGPYGVDEIERRLTRNEIGMFHEVQVNGEWRTLRIFLQERESARRAARERQEQEERQAKEEAAREAEQRAAELEARKLKEEKRRNDLLEAAMGLPQRRPISWTKLLRNAAIITFLLSIGMCFFQAQRVSRLESQQARMQKDAASLKIDESDLIEKAGRSAGFRIGEVLFDTGITVEQVLQQGLRAAAQSVLGELEKHDLQVKAYRAAISECSSDINYAVLTRNWSAMIAALALIAALVLHVILPRRRHE